MFLQYLAIIKTVKNMGTVVLTKPLKTYVTFIRAAQDKN